MRNLQKCKSFHTKFTPHCTLQRGDVMRCRGNDSVIAGAHLFGAVWATLASLRENSIARVVPCTLCMHRCSHLDTVSSDQYD